MGLHLTDSGLEIMRNAERTAAELEISSTPNLSTSERKTLLRLLKKVYLKP
jgi:DNA-binding MarR family transcriptional regulator